VFLFVENCSIWRMAAMHKLSVRKTRATCSTPMRIFCTKNLRASARTHQPKKFGRTPPFLGFSSCKERKNLEQKCLGKQKSWSRKNFSCRFLLRFFLTNHFVSFILRMFVLAWCLCVEETQETLCVSRRNTRNACFGAASMCVSYVLCAVGSVGRNISDCVRVCLCVCCF
jgi:hypothetical protein